ncbi:MAG: S-layer homology domain-containing protein, partial [Actinomycetota bacterium]|nr:S-layer homology domain-containing protein [Actinomycetota bacterium]
GWSTPPYKIKDYYPGDEVVDLIGISAYNFGDCYATWSSVYQTMGGAVHELRTTVSATKPYIIAQTGSSSCGGDKDAWLRELFAFTAADPNVVALIYFNIDKETDWRVWPDANQGWKDGMLAPTTVYQWPLSSWFQAGPLPFRPRASAFWDDNGSPHEADINKIYTAGITQGCGPGRFCPKDPVTRAQMAAFLLRALPGDHDRHLLGYRGTFQDVPAGLWYTGYVEHLFDGEHRITNGCGSQPLLYCPEQQVTRGQMAAFLVRALGLAPGGDDRFGDDRGHQFEADINALAAVGITKGCGPGRFCPDGPVTREQMASFLARAFLAGS